jgi:hypothetical protein
MIMDFVLLVQIKISSIAGIIQKYFKLRETDDEFGGISTN